jgi:hypothetical protein
MSEPEKDFPFSDRPDAPDHIVEAQKLLFNGPLADWAKIRSDDFAETVKPKHLFIESKDGRPHNVAWLYRSGLDFDTGEPYSFHHVACDCMSEAELREDPELMFSCEALGSALMKRAQQVRGYYGLPEILPVSSEQKMGTGGKQLVISTMVYIMERDQAHPDSWVANYINGRHELPLLSVVLSRDVDEIAEYASMLEEAGKLEIDNGSTIRLSQSD